VNWEAMSAMGEVAGAIAVVVTLIYLARQTKANTKAVAGSSTREIWLNFSAWNREIARDPELKRIARKSLQPEMDDYTGAEWHEFMSFALAMFSLLQAEFVNEDLEIGYEATSPLIEIAGGFVKKYPAWTHALDQWSAILEPNLVHSIRSSTSKHPELAIAPNASQ